eukprot:TRINITY_DN9491_c0_g6_i3.p5 TRINITY_DN9491_c0_g6~~TRINITY_DN9491_c0_g6_i3.p5  ORF type:complete len:127 (-),score=4.39 TRINITY_DN9491_c0_g6_i3:23-403(-)
MVGSILCCFNACLLRLREMNVFANINVRVLEQLNASLGCIKPLVFELRCELAALLNYYVQFYVCECYGNDDEWDDFQGKKLRFQLQQLCNKAAQHQRQRLFLFSQWRQVSVLQWRQWLFRCNELLQ